MKKVLTVLAILVVLTSAVFAAETHKIKIQAEVIEKLPAFQLLLAEKNATTNEGAVRVRANASLDEVEADFATGIEGTTWDLSIDDKTLTFNGTLANKAKTSRSYTLIFVAGVFESGTVNTTLAPYEVSVTKASSADSTLAAVSGTSSALSETETSTYVAEGELAKKIGVTFSDEFECAVGNLADFTVTYMHDSELKIADDYEAAIKMIVVAD